MVDSTFGMVTPGGAGTVIEASSHGTIKVCRPFGQDDDLTGGALELTALLDTVATVAVSWHEDNTISFPIGVAWPIGP